MSQSKGSLGEYLASRMCDEVEMARIAALMEQGAVFVFGSNERGVHGKGAAKEAAEKYGAVRGHGYGRYGHSFAVPTMETWRKRLTLDRVRHYVGSFIDHALDHSETVFAVTRLGCGLAGYSDEQIAMLFKGAPDNCRLPIGWRSLNGEPELVDSYFDAMFPGGAA